MPAEQFPGIYLYRRLVQAKLFIDRHYMEDIDLNNIADEAYFSKFHFIRLFKKIYSKTPHQYLIHVRIEQARQLLIGNKSISEVCFLVGFASTTSFAVLFKKRAGLSPSQFQEQQQKRNLKMASKPLHFIPNCFAETHGWTKNRNFRESIQ
jgi:AraC-like DNA-binding protein